MLASSMLMVNGEIRENDDGFNARSTIEAQEDEDFVLMESKRVTSSARTGPIETQLSSVTTAEPFTNAHT